LSQIPPDNLAAHATGLQEREYSAGIPFGRQLDIFLYGNV